MSVQSSSSSIVSAGVKRGFAGLLDSFTDGTPEIEALFQLISGMDFKQKSTDRNVNSMVGLTELVDLKEVVARKCCFLVPSMGPAARGKCTPGFLFSAPSVVCGLEADLTGTGNGILLRVYGEF